MFNKNKNLFNSFLHFSCYYYEDYYMELGPECAPAPQNIDVRVH